MRIEKPYSFKIGPIYFGEETFTFLEPMLFSSANFNCNFEVIDFSLHLKVSIFNARGINSHW